MIRKEIFARKSKQSIVDVFPEVYGELYDKSRAKTRDIDKRIFVSTSILPNVTAEEVEIQLRHMKKGNAGDSDGLVVEMLQFGNQVLRDIIAALFPHILRLDVKPPESWKQSFIKALYKKGP